MTFKLYNGAPNRALQEYWNSIASMKEEAIALGYRIVWLPVEEAFYGISSDYKEVLPDRSSVFAALRDVRLTYATRNLL